MFVSQDFFDETLVESQELFEYTDEQAVTETISELKSGNASVQLDHLSLTHPDSEKGKADRQRRSDFVQAMQGKDIGKAMQTIKTKEIESSSSLSVCTAQALALQHDLLTQENFALDDDKTDEDIRTVLAFSTNIMSAGSNVCSRQLKLKLGPVLQKQWGSLFRKRPSLRSDLVRLAHSACNACEDNKKIFVRGMIDDKGDGNDSSTRNGLEFFLEALPKAFQTDHDNTQEKERTESLVVEMCRFISILGKFQVGSEPTPEDGKEPLVSSAHANVSEMNKYGAVSKLYRLAKQVVAEDDNEVLLSEILSALRVMAIDNDIVQNMVAVGVLDIADASLRLSQAKYPLLAAATLGLLRNLCANDEIKRNVCKKSLNTILHAMEVHDGHATVQEHGCGIMAAMALREPRNAQLIIAADGPNFIIKSMEKFPNKVTLQRQGSLALRNIACRLDNNGKRILLDAGALNVLQDIAAKHQGSIEESFAALRDLGYAPSMYKIDEHGNMKCTEVFGSTKSNFRPVYE